MQDVKLIIVCGMSGVGKSTTAQNISYQYTMNNIKHEWYHEEMEDHPIRWANGGEFTVGDLNTEAGMELNIADTYMRWEALIKEMQAKGGVYVMEGCLYTNINRYFFSDNYPDDSYPEHKIIEYYDKIMEILKPANPHVVHLYRPDVAENYKRAFKVRGKRWENIITDGLADCDFAVYTAYQALARKIFADYQGKKLAVDTSNDSDWASYYKEICEFLEIDFYDRQYLTVSNPEKYVGTFEYENGEEKESITVIYKDNILYCSPEWFTHIKMNAIGEHEFELSAFPMIFKYSFSSDSINLTVNGNYDWGIVGKTLKRTV